MGKHYKTTPKECVVCGEIFDKSPKETHAHWGTRIFCSKECFFSSLNGRKAERSNAWRGEKVKYGGIHQWLSSAYGKADRCEGVVGIECKGFKKFEWALLKGKEYERKRENFRMLCTSCHRRYDFRKSWNKGTTKIANINCGYCGVSFWPAGYKPRQFCSNTCSARFRAQKKRSRVV